MYTCIHDPTVRHNLTLQHDPALQHDPTALFTGRAVLSQKESHT